MEPHRPVQACNRIAFTSTLYMLQEYHQPQFHITAVGLGTYYPWTLLHVYVYVGFTLFTGHDGPKGE
jgi:hypothetical protein